MTFYSIKVAMIWQTNEITRSYVSGRKLFRVYKFTKLGQLDSIQ